MHILASVWKGTKSQCSLVDMKGKLICGGTASENERVSHYHTLPLADCFSYPEFYSHYKVCMTAKSKKMGMVYFLEQKQIRGREREEKEAEDGSKEPVGVCALPNGISTLHPTAL